MFQVVFSWKGVQFPFISLYVAFIYCICPVMFLSFSFHVHLILVLCPCMFLSCFLSLPFHFPIMFFSFPSIFLPFQGPPFVEVKHNPRNHVRCKKHAESETDLAACNTSNQKPVIFVHCNALWCAVMLCDEMCCGAVMLWCCDAVMLWCCDAVMLWCCDAVMLWCCDAVMLWCCERVIHCKTMQKVKPT